MARVFLTRATDFLGGRQATGKASRHIQNFAICSAIIKQPEMEVHDPAIALADTAEMLQDKNMAQSEPSSAISSLGSFFAWH